MRRLPLLIGLLLIVTAALWGAGAGAADAPQAENHAPGQWTVRSHEQDLSIARLASGVDSNVYAARSTSSGTIFTLAVGDTLRVTQEAEGFIAGMHEAWLKVESASGQSGWILLARSASSNAKGVIPYYAGRWALLDVLSSGGSTWTLRTMLGDSASISGKVDLLSAPAGSSVVGSIEPAAGSFEATVKIVAISEELGTSAGLSERWVLIEYEGRRGWVFGSKLGVNRGGPKYLSPAAIISAAFAQ